MASAVLQVVGGYFFGPVGAAIGGYIGQGIDTMGKNTDINKMDSLDSNVGSYGGTFTRIYGSAQTNGHLIFSEPYKEVKVKKKNSGKGDKSTTTDHQYFGTFAIKFTNEGIYALRRLWLNDKLYVDLRETNYNSPGDVKKHYRFYNGSMSQQIDSAIKRNHGNKASAYRGCSYIVFEDLPLTDFYNQFPNLKVELVDATGNIYTAITDFQVTNARDTTRENALSLNKAIFEQDDNSFVVVSSGSTELFGSKYSSFLKKYDGRTYELIRDKNIIDMNYQVNQGYGHNCIYVKEKNVIFYVNNIINSSTKGINVVNLSLFTHSYFNYNDPLHANQTINGNWEEYRRGNYLDNWSCFGAGYYHNLNYRNGKFIHIKANFIDSEKPIIQDYILDVKWHINESKNYLVNAENGLVFVADSLDNRYVYLANLQGSKVTIFDKNTDENYYIINIFYDSVSDCYFLTSSKSQNGAAKYLIKVNFKRNIVTKLDIQTSLTNSVSTELNFNKQSREFIFNIRTSSTNENNHFLKVKLDTLETSIIDYNRNSFNNSISSFDKIIYNESADSYICASTYSVGTQVNQSFNALSIYVGERIKEATTPLSQIIRNELSLTPINLSKVVTDELDNIQVYGYRVNSDVSTRAVLDQLSDIYAFESKESGGKLTFIKQEQNLTFTINEADLGARNYQVNSSFNELLKITRTNDFELPLKIALSYYDKNKEYQRNTQESRRAIESTSQSISNEYPIVLLSDEAKNITARKLQNAWVSRDSLEFSLNLYDYYTLQVGDVGTIRSYETDYVVKITDIEVSNGVMNVKARTYDNSIYTQRNDGTTGLVGNETIDIIASTDLQLLDIPIFDKSYNNPGFFAVAGASNKGKWRGANIYEIENINNSNDLTLEDYIDTETVIGQANTSNLLSFLNSDNEALNYIDYYSYIDVKLNNDNIDLESVESLDDIVNVCLVGKEILQFKYAKLKEGTNNEYRLSHLLRYRLATEYAQNYHGLDNELFILFQFNNNSLKRFEKDNELFNVDKYFKAISYRSMTDNAKLIEFKNSGIGLKPFSILNLEYFKQLNNDIYLRWNSRSRGRIIWNDTPSVDLDGDFYKIEVYKNDVVVRAVEVTELNFTYTELMQLEDFNELANDIEIKVYKVNKNFGLGFDKSIKIL